MRGTGTATVTGRPGLMGTTGPQPDTPTRGGASIALQAGVLRDQSTALLIKLHAITDAMNGSNAKTDGGSPEHVRTIGENLKETSDTLAYCHNVVDEVYVRLFN